MRRLRQRKRCPGSNRLSEHYQFSLPGSFPGRLSEDGTQASNTEVHCMATPAFSLSSSANSLSKLFIPQLDVDFSNGKQTSHELQVTTNSQTLDYSLEEYDKDPYALPRAKLYKIVDDNIVQANFGPQAINSSDQHFHWNSCIYNTSEREIHTRLHIVMMDFAKALMRVSPFPNGHVVVIDENPISGTDRDYFYEKLTRLMTLAGCHVYSLSFLTNLDYTSSVYWYKRLVEIVSKMKSLRTLQIRIFGNKNTKLTGNDSIDLVKSTETQEFPKLPCLAVLDFENVPICVTANVIMNNITLEYVQLRASSATGSCQVWNRFEHKALEIVHLTNLKELSIKVESPEKLHQLRRMKLMPLKKITIFLNYNVRSIPSSRTESNQDWILYLNQFEGTLATLRISFGEKPNPNARLCLPKLTNLEVYFENSSNLNFALNLEQMQQLKIVLACGDDDRKNAIDYLKCITNIEACNIWDKFRSLRKVQILDCFTTTTMQTYCYNHPGRPNPVDTIY